MDPHTTYANSAGCVSRFLRREVRGLRAAAWLTGLVLAAQARAFEGRIDTGRTPIRPPTPVLHIAEPRAGRLTQPPTRISVFFQRFEDNLNASSLELWIDGVEYTESLRFWTDRAWLELPRGFNWGPGAHVIQVNVLDGTGELHRDTLDFDLIAPGYSYIWPFDYETPNVVANLMEDYQRFDVSEPAYWHHGVDIRADEGATVRAVIGGYIGYRGHYCVDGYPCGPQPIYHNVTIVGDDDMVWQYGHMEADSIANWSVGDRVEQGEVLGNIVTWPTDAVSPHQCGEAALITPYDHLHLNSIEIEGFDVAAWRAVAQDPQQTPDTLPPPLSDGFKWHNPLRFLALAGDADAAGPEFTGEADCNAPDIYFLVNGTNSAITAQVGNQPLLSGDVDIVAHLSDARDLIPGIPGQPYTLGLYELAYSVVPLNPGCFKGRIPRTPLAQFDVVPGEFDVALQDLLLLDVFKPYFQVGFASYETEFDFSLRNFFYTVTNSHYGTLDGENGYWNTDGATLQGPLFSDGEYRVTVYAVDFAGNEVSQSVDVVLDNGLEGGGFCPTRITHLAIPDFEMHDPAGGMLRASATPVPVAFDQIIEGSARTTVAAADWPPFYFDDPTRGLRVAVGILCGNQATVEYVPYLGDVILEVPAEVLALPLVTGAPPPEFDCTAPSMNPVTLRISTRLARRPDTGQVLLGAPHGLDQTEFQLVAAEPIDVNGEPWLLTTAPGGAASWVMTALGDCDGDGDVTLADFATFASCITGPDTGSVSDACGCSDLDGDLDVDLADFHAFQRVSGFEPEPR